jgi:hypothetical protein
MNLKSKLDIIKFARDPKLLNIDLLHTQEVLLKAMYGLTMTKKDKSVFEDVAGMHPPEVGKEFQEVVMILGRGSGKSTIAGIVAVYEACMNDWRPYLRKGELGWVFVVSTREQQAVDIGRNIIFSFIKNSSFLRKLIVENSIYSKENPFPRTKTGVMVLKTGVAVTALPFSARVGRGYPVCVMIMDEVGWFPRESKAEDTDQGIYDATIPRMIQFGKLSKMLLISSPGDETGLLWRKWKEREKKKALYLCLKSPTWKIRTDYDKDFFERNKILSPLSYYREFGADFSRTLNPLMTKGDIYAVMREEGDGLEPDPKYSYIMAFDAAFTGKDHFAVGVGHSQECPDGRFRVVLDVVEVIDEYYGKDLVDTAVDRIVELYRKYNVFEVYCDRYQVDAFSKLLDAHGVNVEVVNWTTVEHRLRYGRLKTLVKRKLVELPNNEELADELSGMQLKFLPTSGQYTVVHRADGHDDMADVVAEICFRLGEDEITGQGGVFMGGREARIEEKT